MSVPFYPEIQLVATDEHPEWPHVVLRAETKVSRKTIADLPDITVPVNKLAGTFSELIQEEPIELPGLPKSLGDYTYLRMELQLGKRDKVRIVTPVPDIAFDEDPNYIDYALDRLMEAARRALQEKGYLDGGS